MGQKTHPKGFRLGVIENWDSRWFAKRDYSQMLHEDIRLRNFIKKRLYHAGISKVEIERAANKAKINIYTARPGIVIGKKGAEIEKLKQELTSMTGKEPYINIHEVRRPDRDAHGRPGHSDPEQRSARWCRNRTAGVVPRGAGAAPHVARRRQLRNRRGE